MNYWSWWMAAEDRRRELLREADQERLLRISRPALGAGKGQISDPPVTSSGGRRHFGSLPFLPACLRKSARERP